MKWNINLIKRIYKEKKDDVYAIFLLSVCILVFHIVYIFSYIPLQEGWHSILANKILLGQLPYKDFHLMLPPVFPYVCAGIIKIFGDTVVTLRLYGLFERIVLFIPIYLMLRRITSVKISFFAVTTGAIYYTSTNADFINTFYQTTILFGIFSLYFLLKSFDYTEKECFSGFLFVFLAGIFCSLSILTKQSTGFFIFIATILILFINYIVNKSISLKKYFIFFLGVFIPFVCLYLYLETNGILLDFYNSIFAGALNSKGSSIDVIFCGFLKRFQHSSFFVPLVILVMMIIYSHFSYKKTKKIWNDTIVNKFEFFDKKSDFIIITIHFLLIMLIILTSTFLVLSFVNLKVDFIKFNVGYLCNFLFMCCTFCVINFVIKYLKNKSLSKNEESYTYLFIFSFLTLYSHGLSWQIEPHGMYLFLPLFITYVLKYGLPYNEYKNYILYVSIYILIFTCCSYKYSHPLSWWGDTSESVHYAKYNINSPKAKFIKTSKAKSEMYNDILSFISKECTNEDKIYTFPNIVAINYLSGKKSDTFTTFPYWDTYPDWLATRDAIILNKNKPKVIIYQDYGEMINVHELMFRQGNHSGQSDIIYVIKKLSQSGEYNFYKKYPANNHLEYPIYVWYRK